MPLFAQSLKIEFSHNNCALQEVFFFQAWIWQKIGLPGLSKRENEEELVYQACLGKENAEELV
jgi:hypothetical protein